MTYRILRASALTAAALALATPGVAAAHGHHGPRAALRCAGLESGRVPARVTTDQATALKGACDTYAAAVKAADDAYPAAATPAADAYRTTAQSLRTAEQTRRSACAADRHAQACSD